MWVTVYHSGEGMAVGACGNGSEGKRGQLEPRTGSPSKADLTHTDPWSARHHLLRYHSF